MKQRVHATNDLHGSQARLAEPVSIVVSAGSQSGGGARRSYGSLSGFLALMSLVLLSGCGDAETPVAPATPVTPVTPATPVVPVTPSATEVNFSGLPVLTRTNNFEITASAEAYPVVQAQASGAVQSFPADGVTFGFDDIRLTGSAAAGIQLANNTPRTFRQMLWRKSNGALIALDFGAQTIAPFSTTTVQAAGLTGDETFLETAGLFRPRGYRVATDIADSTGCTSGARCPRRGNARERRAFERELARMKMVYNTFGISQWASDFAKSPGGCLRSSYAAACATMGGDAELYMLTQIGRMSLHPRGVSSLGVMVNSGAVLGVAAGCDGGYLRIKSDVILNSDLNAVHHESAHNYCYGHETGMTYGMSESIATQLRTVVLNAEALPQRVVVATPTNDPNTWAISVLSRQEEAARPMRFMFQAMEDGFSVGVGQVQGNTRQFFLRTNTKPVNAFAIKAIPDAPRAGDPIGSVVLQAK